MRFFSFFLFLLSATTTFAQSSNRLNRFREITGFEAPESIAASETQLFVSNLGKNGGPSTKDGNGFIAKLDKKQGKVLEMKWITGLDAPKGLWLAKNTLYVTDIDKILGFDIKTGKKTFELAIPNVIFLNDITMRDANTMYVSATDVNKIFEVNIAKKTAKALELALPEGTNGLYYHAKEKAIYVCGFSKGDGKGGAGKITNLAKTPKYDTLNVKLGYLDGICVPEKNYVIFSDWTNPAEKNGAIQYYDMKTEVTKTIPFERRFGGPADFFLDTTNACFYIPCMTENKVFIQQIGGILEGVEVMD
jgi:DNA-binding beta-propeller fold protein YncE